MVVFGDESGEGGAELGEVLVGAAVDDLFLEGAVEAFDDAVGLGFAEEGEAGGKAVVAGVGLEVVAQILGAVVVAQLDAARGAGHAAEGAREGLRGKGVMRGKGVRRIFLLFLLPPDETYSL